VKQQPLLALRAGETKAAGCRAGAGVSYLVILALSSARIVFFSA
jgi:hypothetical protein